MKQPERTPGIWGFLLVSGVAVLLLLLGLSTLDRLSPNRPLSIQPTGISTGIKSSTSMPNVATQRAIVDATWSAITRTPFPTQAPVPTGTREGDMIKFTAEKLFLVALNGWGGYLDGNSVVIYAGCLLEDPEQGAIVFQISLPYRFYHEKILTPAKHGSVRVVAEQNNRLTLVAVDGEVFYFDIPARRFVASLTEVVPTATPLPSLTPTAYGGVTPTPTFIPYPFPTEPGVEVP